MRKALTQRLQYLSLSEGLSALAIPAGLPILARAELGMEHGWEFVLAGSLLLGFLLAQGAVYWRLKLRGLRGHPLPGGFRPAYSALRRVDLALLCAFAPILAWAAITGAAGTGALLLSTFLYAASWAEYVNYYVFQLMNETRRDRAFVRRNRRLRRPALRREVEAGSRRAAARHLGGSAVHGLSLCLCSRFPEERR